MEKNTPYNWKFTKLGGVTRISIETGADIAHLGELDQKMWTVLSCPTSGLEFDEHTLRLMDEDGDGKIRVNEVIDATQWVTKVLRDPEILIKPQEELPLSALNQEYEDGRKLYVSARQILANLGKEKETISLDDTADSTKIFAKTQFNGDGVITACSTDDADLKSVIALIAEKIGTQPDRSGEDGVNAEQIEDFYKEASDFVAWQSKANEATLPYGDKTPDAHAAYTAIKDKVDDYYVRCKLAAYNKEQSAALEMTAEQTASISGMNLATCIDELAKYPLAHLTEACAVPFGATVNPAWRAKLETFKSLVLDVRYPGKDQMTEETWQEIVESFKPYETWVAEKAGGKVESAGVDTIKGIVEKNRKADLLSLVEQDLALKDEADAICQVDKLLHLYRDIFVFLRNFVTFSDFYSSDRSVRAIFQAGTLFIDQRSCDLCMRVADMAKHDAMAAASGMYLIYCDCTSKKKNASMKIVAVMTDGDVDNLMVGKNAIFYDRDGSDWDAVVTKIVDNPISIRQAFWSPYKKFGKFINEQISKFAQEKDSKMTEEATAKISEGGSKMTTAPDAAGATEKPEKFDIAKYCGIFAAIGLAVGYIGGFLVSIWEGFISLTTVGMILALIGLVLIISGPSMLLAWMSLRKRNLSPLLNANGWAVNAQAYVNIVFGATLTKIAAFPVLTMTDPFADKGVPKWKIALSIIIMLAIIFALLYFNNLLSIFGLPYDGAGFSDLIGDINLTKPVEAATDSIPTEGAL